MGLREKLRAIGGTNASAAPVRAGRGGLVVRTGTSEAGGLLRDQPDPRTLRRLGVDFPWPGAARLLFLDTETTGLSGGAGTLCFMVGLGYLEGDQFVTEQYLLGDYPDEPALMARLAQRMGEFDALVTFNGRAFDLPLLQSRATMTRMRLPQLPMIDLLPPARRLWKRRLGTVRLSVLEEKVLRQNRVDDLPGSEAPKRFFTFLKTGDASLLEPVLAHNAQDVRSMLALLDRLLTDYAEPGALHDQTDLYSLGRALERQGEPGEAIRCYHMASLPRAVTTIAQLRGQRVAGEALFAVGMLYKRLQEYERAMQAFELLCARGQMGTKPMIELAKHGEHRAHDLEKALGWTTCALALETDACEQAALERRKARLTRKMNRSGGTLR